MDVLCLLVCAQIAQPLFDGTAAWEAIRLPHRLLTPSRLLMASRLNTPLVEQLFVFFSITAPSISTRTTH
jgi:hypothetical protein